MRKTTGEPPFSIFVDSDDAEGLHRGSAAAAGALEGPALLQLAEQLRRSSPQERVLALKDAMAGPGFNWLSFSRVVRVGATITRAAVLDSHLPRGWGRRYVKEGFFDVDLRVQFACRHEWPLVWDLQTLQEEPAKLSSSGLQQSFIAGIEATGMLSGVTVGLATEHSLEHCIVTLSSDRAGKEWMTDATVGHAYALAVAMHTFASARYERLLPALNADDLGEEERGILWLISEGLSDADIAVRLGIPVHQLGFHLRRIKHIFNTRNRVQLAYVAGHLLAE